jgi:hypothetical protein
MLAEAGRRAEALFMKVYQAIAGVKMKVIAADR